MKSTIRMETPRRRRPSKDEMYLDIAQGVALRSTCLRRNFGVVIVKGDEILAQAYGGAPRGTPSCTDVGFCSRARVGARRGQRFELCRAVHAEQDSIIQARGRDTIGSTLYLVGLYARTKERLLGVEPCMICKRFIINAGIKRVVVSAGTDRSKAYSVKNWIEAESRIAMFPSEEHSESLSKDRSSLTHMPVLNLSANSRSAESEGFKRRIATLKPGNKDAATYQQVVLEILDFLFNPALIDGEKEVRTLDGTERRDIVFTNDSNEPFWSDLRSHHSCAFIMFETKNVTVLENTHFNQTATYLGDRLGTLGFIVTRSPLREAQQRKAYSIYNDSRSRKVVLVLSDYDLFEMLDMKCAGEDPMRYIQKLYRAFRTRVQ